MLYEGLFESTRLKPQENRHETPLLDERGPSRRVQLLVAEWDRRA